MSQRAALYTVAVHTRAKGSDLPTLGNIDGAGTSLADVFATYLTGYTETSKDGARVVRSLSVSQDADDLFAVVAHGRSGTAGDIVDPSGTVRLRVQPDDVQVVRSGCLFRLPATATSGLLAVQVNDGRGMKELFVQGLTARLRAGFPALTLSIDRFVEVNLLRDAVARSGIERLRLARIDPAGGGDGKWIAGGVASRVELELAPAPGAGPLVPDLIRRYLAGDQSAFAEIVQFEGLRFDEAWVEVILPDATRRLFDIAHPDTARPVSRNLPALEVDDDGEPTGPSLLAGLRAVLEGAVTLQPALATAR